MTKYFNCLRFPKPSITLAWDKVHPTFRPEADRLEISFQERAQERLDGIFLRWVSYRLFDGHTAQF